MLKSWNISVWMISGWLWQFSQNMNCMNVTWIFSCINFSPSPSHDHSLRLLEVSFERIAETATCLQKFSSGQVEFRSLLMMIVVIMLSRYQVIMVWCYHDNTDHELGNDDEHDDDDGDEKPVQATLVQVVQQRRARASSRSQRPWWSRWWWWW